MPTFDIIVLGCGGGPSEYNLSSYLLKSCDMQWHDGIVGLEAGSGFGALCQLLRSDPHLFSEHSSGSSSKSYSAAEVCSWIKCYLITHAHLDHINGLVLSAGTTGGPPRRVHAAHHVLKDIESVFSDRLWPNLGSWNEDDERASLIYSELHIDSLYKSISSTLSVLTMPLSHGQDKSHCTYDSSAFFIRHDPSSQEFLFFGDVEPDSIASKPRNRPVWSLAASKIVHGRLSAIFIECSYPLGRKDQFLYGHLNPEHLAVELTTLAKEVVRIRKEREESVAPSSQNGQTPSPGPRRKKLKRDPQEEHSRPNSASVRGALEDVRVYIIHCKEDIHGTFSEPINKVIADQVQALTDDLGLGVEIVAVEQGMRISI